MKKFLFALLLIILSGNLALADNIFLKDGSQLKGKITQVSDGNLTIQTDYGTVNVPKNRILNVIYEDQSASEQQTQEEQPKKKEKKKKEKDGALSEPESWYMNLFFGIGNMRGQDDLEGANDTIKNKPAFYFNMSFLGTVNDHLLLGGGISVVLVAWKESGYDGMSYEDQNSIGFSLIHLDMKVFLDEIGSGIFFSIAPGLANLRISTKRTYSNGNEEKADLSSDLGVGIKGGIGMAFDLNRFNNCFVIGAEGYYATAKVNKWPYYNTRMTLTGVYGYLGWLW